MASMPPRMQNTDGDELLWTTEHFSFEVETTTEIVNRLASIDGLAAPDKNDAEQAYIFGREGKAKHGGMESTLLGQVYVSTGKLRIESNSIERADAHRKKVKAACGKLLRHRIREHSDPVAQWEQRDDGAPGPEHPPEIPTAEANRILLEYKEKHYADWVMHPLPALDGKTPQEAVRTKAGRQQVDLLLKYCENREAHMPAEQRYDFGIIRRQLGLKEEG